jgi:hypothetical protein
MLYKECGWKGCRTINGWTAETCSNCGRQLVPRPKKIKRLALDKREEREGELLDEWIRKTVYAVTKVRYYRNRLRQLDRERANVGKPKPPRHAKGIRARAIRVRPEPDALHTE